MPAEDHSVLLFREVARLAPVLLFATDARGRLTFTNERFYQLVGCTADELGGDGWLDFVHSGDRDEAQQTWHEKVQRNAPFSMEFRMRRVDRTFRWVEWHVEPTIHGESFPYGWVGVANDIDTRRRALDALDLLAASGASISRAQDITAILTRLAETALSGIADVAIFDFLEEDGTWTRFSVCGAGVSKEQRDAIDAFQAPAASEPHPIAKAMREGMTVYEPFIDERFIISRVSDPARQQAWRLVNIQSFVAVPLFGSHLLGALTLLRTLSEIPFDKSDVQVLEEVGRRVGVAIENVRLNDAARRAARMTEVIAQLGEALWESLEVKATLDGVMAVLVPEFAQHAFITLVDENDEAYIAASIGTPMAPASCSTLELPLLAGTVVRGTLTLCFGQSGRALNAATRALFAEFANRIAPAIANAELYERARRVATSFQAAALPSSLPIVKGYTFNAIYEAGRAEALVGGDWYDAFELLDGRVVVSIGDVAGSGLKAAVTMASVRQAIRSVAQVHADPLLMMEAADRVLRSEGVEEFVTAFVGVLDPEEQTLAYQSAGHPSPVLRHPNGTCQRLMGGGLPLGMREEEHGELFNTAFPPGTLLVLFTDGLIESNHDIEDGERRLLQAATDEAAITSEFPAQVIFDAVLRNGSKDDVAILTVRAVEAVPSLRWVIDTGDEELTRRVRQDIVAELSARNYSPALLYDAETIMVELIGNLWRHAPGKAEITLKWVGRHPVLRVRDGGPGFEFAAKLPSDQFSENGRGLYIVTSLACDFSVARRRNGGSDARVVLREVPLASR